MSFLKSLFGLGGPKEPAAPKVEASEDYQGYTIKAAPMPAGAEHQLAGAIEKEIGGVVKVHRFIRADRMPSREDAARLSLAKGRQIVDQQGDSMFRDDEV